MMKLFIRGFRCRTQLLASMKTCAERICPLALPVMLLGVLSISGCMGIAGQNSSTPAPTTAISVSPPSIAFGSVAVGSTVSQSITVTNTGGSDLSITKNKLAVPGFSVTGVSFPMTISAGQQSTMNVVFSPKNVGGASGKLSLMNSASKSPAVVTVSGTGVASTPTLSFSSTSLDFGKVVVGKDSVLGITLTNTGNANVSISQVKISGAGITASGVPAGTILAPDQKATLNVSFAPTGAGSLSERIAVVSNAINSPAMISLSGSAVHSRSKSTILSWTASTSAVVGYNVYRSTVSGGPYTKINSSIVTGTSYADSTAVASTVYYYVVTAVTPALESPGSNQASANIPPG